MGFARAARGCCSYAGEERALTKGEAMPSSCCATTASGGDAGAAYAASLYSTRASFSWLWRLALLCLGCCPQCIHQFFHCGGLWLCCINHLSQAFCSHSCCCCKSLCVWCDKDGTILSYACILYILYIPSTFLALNFLKKFKFSFFFK